MHSPIERVEANQLGGKLEFGNYSYLYTGFLTHVAVVS